MGTSEDNASIEEVVDGRSDAKADGEEAGEDICEGGDEDGDDDDDDDGMVWEDLYACPLTVRFTQDKIHPFFYRRGPIVNVIHKIHTTPHRGDAEPLGVSPAEVSRGTILELVPPFGPIHCLRKGKHLWSLDNRRLYALQLAAMHRWPQQCCVRLLSSDRLPRKKFKTQYRKFKTQSEGQVVHICAKYQQFDTWNWFERAVEIEWETISHHFGTILSVFEILPVIGALLFRTGITGLTSRAPLIAAFVATFALDFFRQRLPAGEKQVAELHVKAILDGDIKYCPSCRRDPYESSPTSLSAPQLASMMALFMLLVLPYVLIIPHDKTRSSIFSCWLGISCVLLFQLIGILRNIGRPCLALAPDSEDDADATISPKHRDHSGQLG
jgi:hypothetical protein